MLPFFSSKPPAVPAEFCDLAKQIMKNEGWETPTNAPSALNLYNKLVLAINALESAQAD